MRTILSGNYRDRQRGPDHKWFLARGEQQTPEQATAMKRIWATGVTFITDGDHEEFTKYGCVLLAHCDSVVEVETPPDTVDPSHLMGLQFFRIFDGGKMTGRFVDERGQLVERCDGLFLDAQGSAFAYIKPASPPTHRRETTEVREPATVN